MCIDLYDVNLSSPEDKLTHTFILLEIHFLGWCVLMHKLTQIKIDVNRTEVYIGKCTNVHMNINRI